MLAVEQPSTNSISKQEMGDVCLATKKHKERKDGRVTSRRGKRRGRIYPDLVGSNWRGNGGVVTVADSW